ncbi:MAG: chorismate synthase [Muribaculaceae bacterium]|nr:chorismate synthase [Muribaculaceae bacterium]
MNTFGTLFRLTEFGESHGPALGGVIDGMPSGVEIEVERIQHQVNRRRPGQSAIVTARDEKDRVEILSGVFDGRTTGTPIGFIVRNGDQHSNDYENLRDVCRPSHADFTYSRKYGIRDHRGGGRSSARETVSRVVGGAIAMEALRTRGVEIYAYTSSVGQISLPDGFAEVLDDVAVIDTNAVRCPDASVAARMEEFIKGVKGRGDTVGGVVTCVITGLPAGLGQPVFDKLNVRLAAAMMSINAAKGFEIGMGFAGCSRLGSEMNDQWIIDSDGRVCTITNNSGGIQGGISNGMPVVMRVAFKPVATLLQETVGINPDGDKVTVRPKGRHDPCVLPRAVPVVESMAAMTVLDAILLDRATRW